MKTYKTSTGKEHGLLKSLANSSKTLNVDASIKEDCEKKRKEDAKVKKAQYLHKDGEGNYLSKTYCKWPGEPIQQYMFLHGYEYEVPLGLIEEVNNIEYVQRSDLLDKNGVPTEKEKRAEKTHRFVPVSF